MGSKKKKKNRQTLLHNILLIGKTISKENYIDLRIDTDNERPIKNWKELAKLQTKKWQKMRGRNYRSLEKK